jgi:hypothetical protein
MSAAEERLREQRRLTAEARNRAVDRLKAAHPEEYRAYYNEEAKARGITPQGARREVTRARLLRELAALDAKDAR